MDSIPWVHHSREEGSLDYDGRLVRLQVYLKFSTIIHRQQSRWLLFLSRGGFEGDHAGALAWSSFVLQLEGLADGGS
jgi:hypothetical protein